MAETKRLGLGTKLGFGVCDVGGNLFVTVLGFYLLNFITDNLLLGAGLAGTALLVGKIWDGAIDPAIGTLSDRTRNRLGRRRPWMLAGVISILFLMTLMFTNPHIGSQGLLFVWVLVVYILMVTAYSIINIPYGALTPELTKDYDERTSLNAFRMSFAVVGTFIGSQAVNPVRAMFANQDHGWIAVGVVMSVVVAITALITFFAVKEPARAAEEAGEQQGVWKTYAAALKNRPFVIALVTYALHMMGTNIVQAALLFYYKYIVWNGSGADAASGEFAFALMFFIVAALLFIPIWTLVSKRIGKKWTYNLGMGLFALAVLGVYFLAEGRGTWFLRVLMAIAGVGFSTNYVMPFAIIPDTVELDYAEHGVRREGVFYGLWNFINQLGVAFALALNGWVLGWFGYVPNVAQDALSKLGIRLLVGPIAAVFVVIGIVVLSFYPITRKYYDERILPKVRERDAAAAR
ncbi:MAG: MFS transporter [Spirochaetes bacterium]|nr:MFS transporter [Spirochaetota bacterium]